MNHEHNTDKTDYLLVVCYKKLEWPSQFKGRYDFLLCILLHTSSYFFMLSLSKISGRVLCRRMKALKPY